MKLQQEDVKIIILRWQKGLPTKLLANQFKVSQRRIQQILNEFAVKGKIPLLSPQGRKPYAQYPKDIEKIICTFHEKYKMGANYLSKFLREKFCLKIDVNYIHSILLENNMAQTQESKQKRRKPWVRYERAHSLSAGHMDWTECNGKQCCVVLDDASRKILSGTECYNATAEQSIALVQEVIDK
jgi:putative transposase